MPNTFRLSTANRSAPASNTAAVLTYAASGLPGLSNCIEGIVWSLDVAPAAAVLLKIEDGSGTVCWSTSITAAGPGFFPYRFKGTANTALIVTLAAGGSGVTGILSVCGAWQE